LRNTSCSNASCLVSLSTQEVIAAMGPDVVDYFFSRHAPTIDGVELVAHPMELARAHRLSSVPVLLGGNRDEGFMFTALPMRSDKEQLFDYIENEQGFARYLPREYVEATISKYLRTEVHPQIPDVSHEFWVAERILGDTTMTCAMTLASHLLETGGNRVYRYIYSHEASQRPLPFVEHFDEVQFVFAHTSHMNNEERELSQQIASYWYRHAAYGSPDCKTAHGPELVSWPESSVGYLQLDVARRGGIRVVTSPWRVWQCDFSRKLTDAVLKVLEPAH